MGEKPSPLGEGLLFIVLTCGVLALLAVSNDSFWIDEMTCERIASSDSWSRFNEIMKAESGSDAQMPVLQVTMFAWHKVSGGGEWGLRSINVFFWALGTVVLMRVVKTRGVSVMGILLASAANQTSVVSLGFSAFEQLGFLPYGPGRLILRTEGMSELSPWIPLLAAWSVVMLFVLVVIHVWIVNLDKWLRQIIFGLYLAETRSLSWCIKTLGSGLKAPYAQHALQLQTLEAAPTLRFAA